MAPAALRDSPLNCNIRGGNVRIQCKIEEAGFQINWYFTNDESEAGSSSVNQQIGQSTNCMSDVICTSHEGTSSSVTSTLMINPFNNSEHSGYYWCERSTVTVSTNNAILRSQIVNIEANFTLGELEKCSDTTMFDFFSSTSKCAYGRVGLRERVIVDGVQFINYTIIMPNVTMNDSTPTNISMPMDNITNATTETEIDTTIMIEDTAPTGGGSNIVRTAVIWFSVGVAILILVIVAIILGAVAIARIDLQTNTRTNSL